LTTAIIGAGSLVAPAASGWLAERFDTGVPFVVLGLLTGATLLVLFLAPSAEGREREQSPDLREMLRVARADPLMVTSLVLTLAVSIMWASSDLLVPLRLDGLGFDAAQIGVAYSMASVVFIASSAITSMRAERRATVRFASWWTVAFAASVLIAAVWAGPTATIVFLVAAGITTGVMISITYPLGAIGATSGGYSVVVVGALLNLVSAGAALVGPTVGGALAERVGDQVCFLVLAVLGAAAAAWMWLRRERHTEAEPRMP
jgi:predicted MFS family arabinose efflux permease